jgi:hypothetical protein
VANGLGVTVLPGRAVCRDIYARSRLAALPFRDASPTRTVLMAVAKVCPHPEAVEVFAQAITASLGSASGCLPAADFTADDAAAVDLDPERAGAPAPGKHWANASPPLMGRRDGRGD